MQGAPTDPVEQAVLQELMKAPEGKMVQRRDGPGLGDLCVTEPSGLFFCYPLGNMEERSKRRRVAAVSVRQQPRRKPGGG